jgi:methylmalonyl-CoA/ethylmalonyl-CoA epimerase
MNQERRHGADLVFDHIGIVVAGIDAGCNSIAALLGPVMWTQTFDDAGLGVSVRFAQDRSGIVYELIAPFGTDSFAARTLKTRANLLNQIAYRTVSLESSVKRLRADGAVPVSAAVPAVAFGGARVQFLMLSLGFLIELIEGDRMVHVFS